MAGARAFRAVWIVCRGVVDGFRTSAGHPICHRRAHVVQPETSQDPPSDSARGPRMNRKARKPAAKMTRVYLSLGSNVGDRSRHIAEAVEALPEQEVRVVR